MKYVKGQKYVLLAGSVFTVDERGKPVRHRAPYEWEPTESEFEGNKDRIRPVVAGETPDGDVKEINREEGIDTMLLPKAKRFVAIAGSVAELDKLEAQEMRRQKPRVSILSMIKERRGAISEQGVEDQLARIQKSQAEAAAASRAAGIGDVSVEEALAANPSGSSEK